MQLLLSWLSHAPYKPRSTRRADVCESTSRVKNVLSAQASISTTSLFETCMHHYPQSPFVETKVMLIAITDHEQEVLVSIKSHVCMYAGLGADRETSIQNIFVSYVLPDMRKPTVLGDVNATNGTLVSLVLCSRGSERAVICAHTSAGSLLPNAPLRTCCGSCRRKRSVVASMAFASVNTWLLLQLTGLE